MPELTDTEISLQTSQRRRRVPRARLLGVVMIAGILSVGAYEAGRIILGSNLHEVVPGEVYRSAQLSGAELQSVIARYGVKTVFNLRGPCPNFGWYRDECRVLDELGVARHDINFSTEYLPHVQELRQLVQVIERCEYPVLIHCRRGADRTGLASAIFLLLRTETPLQEASSQLSWRYGHVPLGRHNELSDVLEMYEGWLAERAESHRPDLCREWLLEHYRPRHRWAQIEPLDVPARLKRGRPAPARFRAHNRSRYPWHFKQAANCGVHLDFKIITPDPLCISEGGAGYFDTMVPPGGSIELTLPLPAIRQTGRYKLVVDMKDEARGFFYLSGSPPFVSDIEVVD